MDAAWSQVIFYGCLAGGATFLGMYLVLFRESWCRRNSAHLVSYSAGVLLAVGFIHILPEAQEKTEHAALFLLLSFVAFYFLEHHLFFHAGHEEMFHTSLEVPDSHDSCCPDPHPLGTVAFFGMILHSLIDGVVIGTGVKAGDGMGLFSTVGVMAHEIPEGIAMLSILLHYGYLRRRAVLFTAAVALATPAGALLTFGLAGDLGEYALGAMMALATGSFVYIGASDLIPESHRARGMAGSLSLCAGIATALAAGLLVHH